MHTEFLALWTLRVETLKNVALAPVRDPWAFVEDLRHHGSVLRPRLERDPATGGTEGKRIGDQVAKDLDKATLDAIDHQIPFAVGDQHRENPVLGGGGLHHI